MNSLNVIDPEYVNQIYTVNLHYRNGKITTVTGLSVMNILNMPVKDEETRERPMGITVFPKPSEEWQQVITDGLKNKLTPGVPKGEIKYAN